MLTEAAVDNAPPTAERVQQHWDRYTRSDHEVWQTLYARRMEQLATTASRIFLEGAEVIGLAPHELPNLKEVNKRLGARTGWNAVPVGGFLPAKEFFASLSNRRFPTTVTIRSRENIDYVPEPDIFHDVFGHVPLHSDPLFADFLQRFGQAATMARTPEEVEMMARLFWFTIEFGLIDERGRPKIYGSGLISSSGDAVNAMGPSCDRRPFSLDAVISQAFRIDQLQDILFVVDSFEQLYDAVDLIVERMSN